MDVTEKFIIRLESMHDSLNNSLKELDLQKNKLDKAARKFIAHMEILDEKINTLDEKSDCKLETSLTKAFDEQKQTVRSIIDNEIKNMFSSIRKEGEKSIREIKNVRVEDRFKRYLIMGAFCLGMFAVSMGIQWYFPLKNEYNYHLSADMLAQLRMGQYANVALDNMPETEREKFLKHIEKTIQRVLKEK